MSSNRTKVQGALRCPGTLPRRAFLRAGIAGASGLSLAQLLRAESRAAETVSTSPGRSMIVLWLWGGPSHMETFDLKPEAPAEFRGEFRPVPTSVPGLEISEHLPLLARCAHRFSLIRTLSHDSPGHVNSTHTLLSGYPGEPIETPPFQPRHPDVWSVVSRMLGERRVGVPAHVALPRMRYNGAAYLGGGLDPFVVTADPNSDSFQVPNLALQEISAARLGDRIALRDRFDRIERTLDGTGLMKSIDQFDRKAVSLLTGENARRAFDISREDPKTRERYGRHAIGQQCLLARRLVEAGSRLVTVDFPCVPGQKAFSWDDHASVWNIFEQMKIRLPVLDQVVSALIDDLFDRGLQDEVLLVVMGEMSHTPRLSNFQGQPGREHWGRTMSLLLAGGGMKMGQAVGATNARGDEVHSRTVSPNDLLATWYKCLGVPVNAHFNDFAGRPTPIVPNGRPIDELL
jgi:Protein of unknown function (DUF1501)